MHRGNSEGSPASCSSIIFIESRRVGLDRKHRQDASTRSEVYQMTHIICSMQVGTGGRFDGTGADPRSRTPDELVTLYAGHCLVPSTAHTDFACHHSPVVKAAFNDNFWEAQTQMYKLEDASREAILLNHWLYTAGRSLRICN
ncbi:unnamed protein product [Diplocarpon coronariae]